MKKLFSLAVILFLGITILASCSKDRNKPLIVACAASTSPYCYYVGDTNAPVAGIDIDLVYEIGKELGRPVQLRIVPFQYVFTLISRGEADIGAAGITITPEYTEDFLISSPYDTASQVIVVPNDSAIKNESSLKSARIAVQEGASDIDLLRETIKPEAVLPFLTLEEVSASFVKHRADAAVLDAMQADLLVKANKGKYKILGKPLSRYQYGLIFNKEGSKLATVANEVIEKSKVSGALRKSRTDHFHALDIVSTGKKNEAGVKPFIVCLESAFAPFVLMNRNQLVGIDVEIAKEIARELNRPLVLKIVPFTEVLPLVEIGSADMGASGISITPERKEVLLFSQPYEKTARRILVNVDAVYATLDDLKGKVIGAKKGTKSEDYAIEVLQAETTVHFDNAMQGILGLLDHKIDAYIDDNGEADLASDKIVSLDGRRVKKLDVSIPVEEYGFAFQINNTEAKAAADKVIETKRLRGEINALFRKYTSIYMTLDISNL